MNVPIIYIEEIETSLLTLFGRVLGFMEGKADSALSNPCFMTSPSDFTIFEFPISNYFNFQNFVRSRRNSKEKLPGRVPTIHLLHENVIFFSTGLLNVMSLIQYSFGNPFHKTSVRL